MSTDAPMIDNLFLGIGAMKAGTTWAYALLARHPDIYFTFEKEIHYLYAAHVDPGILSAARRIEQAQDRYLRPGPGTDLRALRDRLRWTANYLDGPVDDHWYRTLFALRTHQTWAADFSNLSALLPAAAWRRIAARTGRMKVLYLLRDPVDRLWSHARFHLAHTGQSARLEEWDTDQILRFLRQRFIWDHAEYGAVLRRMRDALPRDAVHVAWYEQATARPMEFLREVESHLDLAPYGWATEDPARRINPSPVATMPPGLARALAPEARRIAEELADLGYAPPASWGSGRVAA